MMSRMRRILTAFAAGAGCLLGVVLLYGPVLGAWTRATRLPPLVHEPFIEDLSSDASTAASQRARLLDAWHAGSDYGLRRTQNSVEGTPIGLWLITSKHQLSLITDYSRDSFSTRGIDVATPIALEIATPAAEDQHPLRAWFPARTTAYLRCTLPNGHVAFF